MRKFILFYENKVSSVSVIKWESDLNFVYRKMKEPGDQSFLFSFSFAAVFLPWEEILNHSLPSRSQFTKLPLDALGTYLYRLKNVSN